MKKHDRRVMTVSQIGLTVLCAFLALVFIAMIFITAYANHYFSLINVIPQDTTLSPDAIASIEDMLTETMPSGYTGPTMDATEVTAPEDNTPEVIIQHENLINILLVGQDRRSGETGRQRSDSMIVVSFNTKNKTITMTSFMRDMYVYIPGYKANKLNAAYARGGFPMLCDALYTNFGIVIDGCVEVDFDGFTGVVDTLGGVTISLTAAEAEHLNTAYGYKLVAGSNHLNGKQALNYSRIRKIGSDFARTERQRTVLNAIMNECRSASLTELMGLLNKVLPMISTDMSSKEITNYLKSLFPMLSGAKVVNLRIPASDTYQDAYISGAGACLVPNLKANQQILANALMPS